MRILVAGQSGQLARCLVDEAQLRPNISLLSLGRADMDVTDRGNVATAINDYAPDVIINAAAYTAVDSAESEPDQASLVNAIAPGIMAQLCQEKSIPLVHISTDYVFEGRGIQPYKVEDQTAPLGIYGQSKLGGEAAVRKNCTKHLIVRTSWVFSEYGNNFVKTMLKLGVETTELSVVADQIGCPTDASDLAKSILSMSTTKHFPSGTYHYRGASALSWCEFAEAIFEEANTQRLLIRKPRLKPVTTDEYPTPAKRPAWSVLDMSTTESVFGLEPIPLKQSLKRVLSKLAPAYKIPTNTKAEN